MNKDVYLREYLNNTIQIGQSLDIAEQYTLVVKPSQEIIERILHFIDNLKSIEPNHLYYKRENLHFTILGNIPINTNVEDFAVYINKLLKSIDFQLEVGGISCTAIEAFPINFSLKNLRQELSNYLGLATYADLPEELQKMTWANVIRYRHPPSETLLEFFKANRDLMLGKLKPDSLYLYKVESRIFDLDKKPEKIISVSK